MDIEYFIKKKKKSELDFVLLKEQHNFGSNLYMEMPYIFHEPFSFSLREA